MVFAESVEEDDVIAYISYPWWHERSMYCIALLYPDGLLSYLAHAREACRHGRKSRAKFPSTLGCARWLGDLDCMQLL